MHRLARTVLGILCVTASFPLAADVARAQTTFSKWTSITPDQRQYAAQPGGVMPLMVMGGVNFAAGNYMVYIGSSNPNGMTVAKWNTFGPFSLQSEDKWSATLLPQSQLRMDRNAAGLLSYSNPGKNRAMIYARNDDTSSWESICVLPVGMPVNPNCFGGSGSVVLGFLPPTGAGASVCRMIPGLWSWFVNGDVTFKSDGTLVQGPRTGQWTCRGDLHVTIVWSHGYTDELTLSPDGKTLGGANNVGSAVAGQRLHD